MTSKYFPGADTSTQNFQKTWGGSKMNTNVLVWHSTEGLSWPGYSGGATAPNLTVFLSIKERKLYARQHFAGDISSRALENRAGGVQTNTLNCFQVEVIGTCDSRYKTSWGSLKAGVDYFYLPDLPQWATDLLAEIPAWLHETFPNFPIKDGAPRGWVQYPGSYGLNAKQRITFSEWPNTYGMIGHEHVPENVHGDPGDLDIKAIVASATGVTVPPAPPVVVPPVIIDPKSPASYFVGAKGDFITAYGERVVLWSAALGLPKPYQIGPSPVFTETDRAATSRLQVAFGFGSSAKDLAKGGNSDGFPGLSTLAKLFSDPAVKPPTTKPDRELRLSGWNLKSPTLDGDWPVWTKRRSGHVSQLTDFKPDVFFAQEVGSPTAEAWYNPQLAKIDLTNAKCHNGAGSGKWRAIWYNADIFTHVTSGLYTIKASLNGDDKQMAECILAIGDRNFYFGSFHLENNNGFDKKTGKSGDAIRVDQIKDVFRRMAEACKAHNVAPEDAFLEGDSNSALWVKEWVEANTDYRDAAPRAVKKATTSILGSIVPDTGVRSINGWKAPAKGDREDFFFTHKDVDVLSYDQRDSHKWSDHNLQNIVVGV